MVRSFHRSNTTWLTLRLQERSSDACQVATLQILINVFLMVFGRFSALCLPQKNPDFPSRSCTEFASELDRDGRETCFQWCRPIPELVQNLLRYFLDRFGFWYNVYIYIYQPGCFSDRTSCRVLQDVILTFDFCSAGPILRNMIKSCTWDPCQAM